jgi:hypothetical protein
VLVPHPAGERLLGSPNDALDSVKYSWENWRYKYVESLGENVEFEFVDARGSVNVYIGAEGAEGAERPPLPQYKDLEGMVVSKTLRGQVCFGHRMRFVRATGLFNTIEKLGLRGPPRQGL